MIDSLQSITRRVGTNSVWLLVARLITQVQLFVFTLLVARGLGTTGFGQYALVAAVMVVGNVATTFGTDTLLIRDVSRAASAGLISAALWLQLALSAIWVVAVFLGAAGLSGLSIDVVAALKLYSLSLIPLAFFTVFTSLLRAHERMDLYLMVNAGMAAVQLGGAWLVVSLDPRLTSLIGMLIGVQVVGALLAGLICRFGLPTLRFHFDMTRQQLQQIVRLAWPFALLSVLAVLYQRLGVLMVSALSGDQQTGLFTAAARVIEPLKIVHLAVLGALLPTLSRLGAQSANGARLFKRTFFGLLAISTVIAVAVITFAQPIVALLYSVDYAPSSFDFAGAGDQPHPLCYLGEPRGAYGHARPGTAADVDHGADAGDCLYAQSLAGADSRIDWCGGDRRHWRMFSSRSVVMAEALKASTATPIDESDVPIMTARDLLAYRWRQTGAPHIDAPPAVIVCYQREPLAQLIKHQRATRVNGFFGEFHVIKIGPSSIGVIQPIGPGAPIAAMVLEELIAFGVKRFISIGLAGGLQFDLRAGDVVVCAHALRDEGTSGHYLPAAPSIDADSDLAQQLSADLSQRDVTHQIGASWTTDAPLRETRGKVQKQRDAGVLTVEMEAAAFLAWLNTSMWPPLPSS